jgi:hypothetical protein
MARSLEGRLESLEAIYNVSPCSGCGGGGGGESDTYELVWTDEAEEEWCETCGTQTGIVVRWPEDLL